MTIDPYVGLAHEKADEADAEDIDRASERERQQRNRNRKVVWLLGAGFSKPLGGPLFSELFSVSTGRWVEAWLHAKGVGRAAWTDDALAYYEEGSAKGLWSNPEEALLLIEEARSDAIAKQVIRGNIGEQAARNIEPMSAMLSQFVAVAATHFVDRVERSATTPRRLPESWRVYADWADCLTENDTVISFNYDRAVEVLFGFRKADGPALLKLHGTVPEPDELVGMINDEVSVSGLFVPGPGKLEAAERNEWQHAKAALEAADRLIVIGYSFPATDPLARSFILRRCAAKRIAIVVGQDRDGKRIEAMFRRVVHRRAEDTRLFAQEFLAEGTARLVDGRFGSWIPLG